MLEMAIRWTVDCKFIILAFVRFVALFAHCSIATVGPRDVFGVSRVDDHAAAGFQVGRDPGFYAAHQDGVLVAA